MRINNSTNKDFFSLRVFFFHEILKVSYILSFLIKGTRNERKVLATSPRSDLRQYKSGMAAACKASTKRPCEDEAEVKINYRKALTHVSMGLTKFSKFSVARDYISLLLVFLPPCHLYICIFLLLTGSANSCQLIAQTILFR